jgi:hypothetical protein
MAARARSRSEIGGGPAPARQGRRRRRGGIGNMSDRASNAPRRPVRRPIESRVLPVHKVARVKEPQRSRITNGSALLPGVDGRGAWVRRAKDLLALHISDLGGEENVSEAERALLRRAVTLIIELERREVLFAQAGAADDGALAIYQTTVNTLRRTLESLGLQRRPRDVGLTLGQILRDGQRDL